MKEKIEKIEKTLKLFIKNFLSKYNYDEQIIDLDSLHTEIKIDLDTICDIFLQGGLIYEYKNICDGSNNYKYVTDLQMIVTDAYIKYEKDGEVFVYNITILKKGMININ